MLWQSANGKAIHFSDKAQEPSGCTTRPGMVSDKAVHCVEERLLALSQYNPWKSSRVSEYLLSLWTSVESKDPEFDLSLAGAYQSYQDP